MKESGNSELKLGGLKAGESCIVRSVGGEGALRQHFLDMGVSPGTEVTVIKLAPMGDPMELRIHGYELTLRVADAGEIGITLLEAADAAASAARSRRRTKSRARS